MPKPDRGMLIQYIWPQDDIPDEVIEACEPLVMRAMISTGQADLYEYEYETWEDLARIGAANDHLTFLDDVSKSQLYYACLEELNLPMGE